jgi:hypothetical protein
MKRILGVALLAAAALFAAAPSVAQPACNLAGEHLMSWPTLAPVWQFCWLRPLNSSGGNGSGLEIRNAYYNGHLVLKRGHMPILNVQYDPGGCGCYRDWSNQEVVFQADNEVCPPPGPPPPCGYAEPTTPPLTVCDTGGSGGDIGTFTGVAAEKSGDPLILTTQFEAGWYRYTIKWKFYLDGRIQPIIGFAAVNASCIAYTHRHHGYWRLDFDIDGPDNDVVTEGPNPAAPGGRSGPRYPIVSLPTEVLRKANKPDITWSVTDAVTRRGYRIVPGAETALPADNFSVADFWALKYKANELDDTGQGGGCPININGFINGEGLSTDVVVWYRTGALHLGHQLDDCAMVGPTLVPIGDWSP